MTVWELRTAEDPLATARGFLAAVWRQASLDAMLVLLYQPDKMSIQPTLIEHPRQLEDADPFVPLMQVNAAKWVAQLARQYPEKRLAAVLRACEVRALYEIVKSQSLDLTNWLIIGTDCLACFPAQDFDWRVQKAGGIETLTRQTLRNARQGGIAIYRYRMACQMCSKPEPLEVDLCFGLLGLPVKDSMLVIPKNDAVSAKLQLERITDGPAERQLIEQRSSILADLNQRRRRFRQQVVNDLPAEYPQTIEGLVAFLASCQPCQVCYSSCPIYTDELAPLMENGSVSLAMVKRWLASCAECGMCEQACPKNVPLAAIMNRISRELKEDRVTV